MEQTLSAGSWQLAVGKMQTVGEQADKKIIINICSVFRVFFFVSLGLGGNLWFEIRIDRITRTHERINT